MSESHNRRGFLRGLTTLPLIGGSVALIGSPTRVAAEPSTQDLLYYAQWLRMEHRLLARELEPALGYDFDRCRLHPTGTNEFHFPLGQDWRTVPPPSTRAALVMSAIDFSWRPVTTA